MIAEENLNIVAMGAVAALGNPIRGDFTTSVKDFYVGFTNCVDNLFPFVVIGRRVLLESTDRFWVSQVTNFPRISVVCE